MRQNGEEDKTETVANAVRKDLMEQMRRRTLATDAEEATSRCNCEIVNTDKAALSSRAGVSVGRRPPALQ